MSNLSTVCGLYYLNPRGHASWNVQRVYLPKVSQSVHARIVASTSRSTLTQTYVNPSKDTIPELRYTFPLYDGVSVVAFTCTINNDRVIRGVVQEKNKARKTYNEAVAKGQTAGLLEQLPDAKDVFTTTIGNVPAAAEIKVEIAYLGELKHDAEVDGIRFTIPTSIAPRYGSYPGRLLDKPASKVDASGGMTIVVDAEMPAGSVIKSIQSPSHPIAVSIGSTSTMAADATPSLQLASATLSVGSAQLEKDFIVHVVATNTSNPVAVLETHPTIPHQQAIMATLVPKFKLAATKPEVVFVCDRSGSMEDKISDLKNALQIFMKSLPVGCMFNICSFGSGHSFLFESSKTYDQDTLTTAMKHIDTFGADYGGTNMLEPVRDAFQRRHKDMDLEVFVLTDGEIWNQQGFFQMVNEHVDESDGAIRLFTLGVGNDVSHSLIEGLARAGRGFSQAVSEKEKMSAKVIRMLKAALTPHVKDYSLEVKYADAESETEPEDDFEIVEHKSPAKEDTPREEPKKTISLFDPSTDDDVEMSGPKTQDDATAADRFSHVPTVNPPKILQAPFQIPPLFPYTRTTVYLLLSPDRELRDKTPESVILRGTSSQGPLELQIPVAILADKAETVHQLAARKAVGELEDGRGWIFHAKDKDGERLQKKHPGRFAAMVEREAVRLGVSFQVGGSWCSFVAVEDTGKESTQEKPEDAKQQAGNHSLRGNLVQSSGPSVSLGGGNASRMNMMSASSQPAPRQHLGRKSFRKQSDIGGAYNSLLSGDVPVARPLENSIRSPIGRFRRGRKKAAPRRTAYIQQQSEASDSDGNTGSLQVSEEFEPPIFHACALAPPPVDEALLESYKVEMDIVADLPIPDDDMDDDIDDAFVSCGSGGPVRPVVMPESADEEEEDEEEEEEEESGFAVYGSVGAVAEVEMEKEEDTGDQDEYLFGEIGGDMSGTEEKKKDEVAPDTFSAIVSLQDFSGFWGWSIHLLRILGITEEAVDKALANSKVIPDAKATALTIAFLRKKMADDHDSWEMMEDKALAWLGGQVGGDNVAKLLDAAATLF